jgi:hypothetical protein
LQVKRLVDRPGRMPGHCLSVLALPTVATFGADDKEDKEKKIGRKVGAGGFAGPKFMHFEGGGTSDGEPSTPACYEGPLPVDVSKVTNREECKDGVEVLPGDAEPAKGAIDEETVCGPFYSLT